ncbi:Hydroxypyruvate isomerase [Planctomycetes bacterium Pla163]|uniref:Hydroxypyruvate isomerase n=1 Tax=Rohdeia mirabilis TaxID=2528008 RepID=A0A518CX50_9BACT|nr:Hydroxypyruvate isomerase [Planctomycetes bacterium Pla163]
MNDHTFDRRTLLGAGLAAGAAAGIGPVAAAAGQDDESTRRPFALDFAPHFGMFRHHAGDDLVDQLRFAADEGFRAWEDNGMMGRDVATQERVGAALRELGMRMGVFVLDADFGTARYVNGDREARTALQQRCREAIEVAERVGAKWVTVVPGRYDQRLEWDYQTANCIDTLKAMCEVLEPAGLTMVLEPLNARTDHPGQFLTKIAQGYLLCRAVDSPACKILDDLYHQQITEGNLIPNIDRAWSEIAYFQVGDNPGRCEPTTGEIAFERVFAHLRDKGFDGVVGMEHGNSRGGVEGERAVIDAYRSVDPV